MKTKRFFSFLVSSLMVLSLVMVNVPSAYADSHMQELVIIHVNDTHARVRSTESEGVLTGVGYDRIAQYKMDLMEDNENVLLLDAGDSIHGQPLATLSRGESIVQLMNAIGVDALSPGNHDFNYGYDRLKELEDDMDFPILAANVVDKSGENVFESYIVKEMDGLRVGIFGLSSPETYYKTNPKNVEDIDFTDPVEAAREAVAALQAENVDMIIGLTHLGLDQGDYTSDNVARGVEGIDVIIDGHSHSRLEEGRMVGDTLIASRGEHNEAFGVVTVKFEGGEIAEKTAMLMDAADSMEIVPNPEVLSLLNELQADVDVVLSEKVGEATVELVGEREIVRTGESNFGQLLADAMLDATDAEVAITNGGGIRASIAAGDITKNDIVTAFPFGNYLVTKRVLGRDIMAALEHGASVYPEQNGAFPHVAGMTFTINTESPAGQRVSELMINGAPAEMQKEYMLVTNDFMAVGGDDYLMFRDYPIVNEYAALDEIMIDYIEENSPITGGFMPRITFNAMSRPELVVPETPQPQMPEQDFQSGMTQQTMNATVPMDMTLIGFSMMHNASWQEVYILNEDVLSNPAMVMQGQVLKVPVYNQ